MNYPQMITFNNAFPTFDSFNPIVLAVQSDYPDDVWHDSLKMYTPWEIIFKQFQRKFGTRQTRYIDVAKFSDKLILYFEDYLIDLFITQQPFTSDNWNVFNDINSLGDLRTRTEQADTTLNTQTTSEGESGTATSPQPFNENGIKITDQDKIKEKVGSLSNESGTLDSNTTNNVTATDKSYNPLLNLQDLSKSEITLKINRWLTKFEPLFRTFY